MSNKVSILMLTHNAPEFVELTISSVRKHTQTVNYEIVVVDNCSEPFTRELVQRLHASQLIDKLLLLDYNSLFAEGNNIAARLAAPDSTHFLLLNSDVEIRHPAWLDNLLAAHRAGISAYGVVHDPLRVDGWCLLVDAPVFRRHTLPEQYQWWWAVTKLQADLLLEGYSVQGHTDYDKYVHHFGGKSGNAFMGARGMETTLQEAMSWFKGRTIDLVSS